MFNSGQKGHFLWKGPQKFGYIKLNIKVIWWQFLLNTQKQNKYMSYHYCFSHFVFHILFPLKDLTYPKVWLIFLKYCRENFSFHNLIMGEKERNLLGEREWKYVAQQISPARRPINFCYWNEIYCLSLIVSQAQTTLIWLNSTIIIIIIIIIIKCKICSKLTIEPPHEVLLFLLLTLNIFDMLF